MARGRPTLYLPEYAEQAERLALLGLTDQEMAEFFKVDVRTIYRWDVDHDEFCQARARGKIEADGKVAHKLYHRAMGYEHRAVKIFMPAGAEEPVYADYTERYPPDTQAATWWLKNRQPAKWKDKSDIEHTVRVPASAARDDDLAAIALSGRGAPAAPKGDPKEP